MTTNPFHKKITFIVFSWHRWQHLVISADKFLIKKSNHAKKTNKKDEILLDFL
jgi:hypothetical protein